MKIKPTVSHEVSPDRMSIIKKEKKKDAKFGKDWEHLKCFTLLVGMQNCETVTLL